MNCLLLNDLLRPSVSQSVNPPVRLSARPSVRPSARSSVRPSVSPSIHPSACPPVRLSVRPSIHSFVRSSTSLSVHPSMYPAFCSSNLLSVWLGCSSYASNRLISGLVSTVSAGRCRRHRCVAVTGGILVPVGCLLASYSVRPYQLFVALAITLPIGTGVTLAVGDVTVSRMFYRHRQCAEMLMTSGSGVGMAVTVVSLNQLLT